MAARGAIRDFWQAFRVRYGKRPYFSWAELQARGAIHYHAIIVNPPWRLVRNARRWIKANWTLQWITPRVDFEDSRWFHRRAGWYVRQYAKSPEKLPPINPGYRPSADGELERKPRARAKSYQQDYENMPREIRTWECNRLRERVAYLDKHRDNVELVSTAPAFAPWPVKRESYWVIARLTHRMQRVSNVSPTQTESPGALHDRRTPPGVLHVPANLLHLQDSPAENVTTSHDILRSTPVQLPLLPTPTLCKNMSERRRWHRRP